MKTNFKHTTILTVVLSSLVAIPLSAQTNNCNDNAAGQLTVGTTCNPVPFNTQDNVNWWTGSGTYGTCAELFGDAWMWFDATSTTTTITYDPLVEDAVLTIFQGACNANGPSIACSDVAGYGGAETITLSTVPGTRYHVRIENYWGNTDMAGTICATSTAVGTGPTTASECSQAVNICTNLSFQVDPNGYGSIDEIPDPGSFSNPSTNPASANSGCLLVGEYNSTWMVVNVATSGNLEFVFGGLGAQTGYYDWIMFPYNASTCAAIQSNTIAPVRCNWNAVSSGGTGLASTIPAGGSAGNFEPPLAVVAGQQYVICFSNYSNLTTTVPLQFSTGTGLADVSCTPLGLSMSGLSVECTDQANIITWSAPIESNTDRFEVQRSRNNQAWETVQTLYSGYENEDMMNFSYMDPFETAELTYYRVKEYTTDGEADVSPIISADCKTEGEMFSIYPNPNNGLMNVEYFSDQNATLTLVDVYGRVLYTQELDRSFQTKKVQLTATDVPDGLYLYHFTNGTETVSGTIVLKK